MQNNNTEDHMGKNVNHKGNNRTVDRVPQKKKENTGNTVKPLNLKLKFTF